MSDELEDFLRSEFAARAQHAPAPDADLADAAIGGARRVRRRRRVAAGAGGIAAVVLAAGAAAWSPLTGLVQDDEGPPAASDVSAQEVQSEFDIEFVAEREGRYGVINTDDEFIAFDGVDEEPLSVMGFSQAYAAVYADRLTLVSTDGTESGTIAMPSDPVTDLKGNSGAEQLAMVTADEVDPVQTSRIYPAEVPMEETRPIEFTTSYELTLQDWDSSTVVFTGPLYNVTTSNPGTYNFEYENDWGMQAIGRAGYDTAVIVDENDPTFACVSDLEPGVGAAVSEECGYVDDPATEELMRESGSDEEAIGLVTATSERWLDDFDQLSSGAEAAQEEFYDADRMFWDPGNGWQIAFDSGDETWTIIDWTEKGGEVSELTPPPGALFPVESFT